jgi:hypothetical protein
MKGREEIFSNPITYMKNVTFVIRTSNILVQALRVRGKHNQETEKLEK